MKIRTLFVANSVVQFLFGIGFIFAPGFLLGLFGTQTDATGTTLAHVAGGVILSLGVIGWLGKDVQPGPIQDAMVWGFTFAHFQAGVLTVLAILGGTFNAVAWPVVAMDAFFTVALPWARSRK